MGAAVCSERRGRADPLAGVSRLGHAVVSIRLAPADCAACPVRERCVGHDRPRVVLVRRQPHFGALLAARQRQTTAEFRRQYARKKE
ncbi:MAG: transposase [Chloroflexi bacterium]|nr:transposase [Chloroflexota bacterium]